MNAQGDISNWMPVRKAGRTIPDDICELEQPLLSTVQYMQMGQKHNAQERSLWGQLCEGHLIQKQKTWENLKMGAKLGSMIALLRYELP